MLTVPRLNMLGTATFDNAKQYHIEDEFVTVQLPDGVLWCLSDQSDGLYLLIGIYIHTSKPEKVGNSSHMHLILYDLPTRVSFINLSIFCYE